MGKWERRREGGRKGRREGEREGGREERRKEGRREGRRGGEMIMLHVAYVLYCSMFDECDCDGVMGV